VRATGTVVRFGAKFFGFVSVDGTRQVVYVHLADVKGRLMLREGDQIAFDVEQTEKGPRATNVELLSGGAA